MRLRVIAKIKNDVLYNYRKENNFTQLEIAILLGIGLGTYQAYENFMDYPKKESIINEIETLFLLSFDDVFPRKFRKIIDSKLGRTFEKTYKLNELPEWSKPIELLPSPEGQYIEKEMKEQMKDRLKESLKTLTEREAKVLTKLFGLPDGNEHSLDEVGQIFNVTRSRIAQIRDKALRKLRHPSRGRKLRSFVDYGECKKQEKEKEKRREEREEKKIEEEYRKFNMECEEWKEKENL